MPKITNLNSIQVLDSRGTPTIRTFITLDNKFTGIATVPSGASTGKYEAVEIRDNIPEKFLGKSVNKCLEIIETKIKPEIMDSQFNSLEEFDRILIDLDNTNDKSYLGANTLLSLSMSFSKSIALSQNLELFESFDSNTTSYKSPVPLMNILNGGKHASLSSDFQEYMIIPIGFESYDDAINCCVKIYWGLKSFLDSKGKSTSVGDEGGFVSPYSDNEEPLKLIIKCIENAGYKPGEEVMIGLDVAASELLNKNKYKINISKSKSDLITRDNLLDFYIYLVDNYPIISIEDPFDQDDWERSSLEVVQYWELQDEDLFRKLNYTFDPSPIWINPKATWEQKKTETGFEIISAMQQGDEHPLFDNYTIEYYRISNSLNWFTGKGRIHGDIWLKSKEGGRNKNPKVEIRAKGSCNPKARKF